MFQQLFAFETEPVENMLVLFHLHDISLFMLFSEKNDFFIFNFFII